jgi:hypothetical protein
MQVSSSQSMRLSQQEAMNRLASPRHQIVRSSTNSNSPARHIRRRFNPLSPEGR